MQILEATNRDSACLDPDEREWKFDAEQLIVHSFGYFESPSHRQVVSHRRADRTICT